MAWQEIAVDPEVRYQRLVMTIQLDDRSIRVRVDFRFLEESEKWYFSISDAQSGESFVLNIPLIASNYSEDDSDEMNDLLASYQYKDLGSILCIPAVDNPTSDDPKLDNIDQFYILWGDSLVQ